MTQSVHGYFVVSQYFRPQTVFNINYLQFCQGEQTFIVLNIEKVRLIYVTLRLFLMDKFYKVWL